MHLLRVSKKKCKIKSRLYPGSSLILYTSTCNIFTATSSVCHQRALSLPIAATPVGIGHRLPIDDTSEYVESQPPGDSPTPTSPQPPQNNMITTTSYTIQPMHQRTRSLPLTEETAIQVTSFHSNASPPPAHNNNNNNNNSNSLNANCTCPKTGSTDSKKIHSRTCNLNVLHNSYNHLHHINNNHQNPPSSHHHHQAHPAATTISHFNSRHNSNHFDLMMNEHHHHHHHRSGIGGGHGGEQMVPASVAMTSSMDSIVEDDQTVTSDDCSMDEDHPQQQQLQQQHPQHHLPTKHQRNHSMFLLQPHLATKAKIGLGGSPLSARRGRTNGGCGGGGGGNGGASIGAASSLSSSSLRSTYFF